MKLRILPLVAAVAIGCAPPSSVDRASGAIIGGTRDTGDPNVILILIGDFFRGGGYLCTGEIISPHVVLTAGHCVADETETYNIYLGSSLGYSPQRDLLIPGKGQHHPDYNDRRVSNDIGVVILDKATDIKPLPFNTNPVVETMVGQPTRMVGYGRIANDPEGLSAGTKRQVTTELSGIDDKNLYFDDTEHNTCEGDSGGPALMMIDGVETIVGITSVGFDSDCTTGGADTRVDAFDEWVQTFVDKYDPPPPPPPVLPDANGKFPPGEIGADCSDLTQCKSGLCANAPNGYCTAPCDPYKGAEACPVTLECSPVGKTVEEGFVCARPKKSGNGCSSVPRAPSSPWILLALLIPLALRRRLS